jgi:hypothetical protein
VNISDVKGLSFRAVLFAVQNKSQERFLQYHKLSVLSINKLIISATTFSELSLSSFERY